LVTWYLQKAFQQWHRYPRFEHPQRRASR
jgi:hypothetical protein